VIFLSAASLHLGGHLVLGPLVLDLGRIIPASAVEGLIGLLFLLTAYALFTRVSWAWSVAVGTHTFALLGVLVGLLAVSRASSPYQALNVGYHLVMLAAILVGLALLLLPGVRTAPQWAGYRGPSRMARHQTKGWRW
jgi:hypothetical protein